jgi:hypothetical protein
MAMHCTSSAGFPNTEMKNLKITINFLTIQHHCHDRMSSTSLNSNLYKGMYTWIRKLSHISAEMEYLEQNPKRMPSSGDSTFMTYVHAVQTWSPDDKASLWSSCISHDFSYHILEATGLALPNSSQIKPAKMVQGFSDVTLCCWLCDFWHCRGK